MTTGISFIVVIGRCINVLYWNGFPNGTAVTIRNTSASPFYEYKWYIDMAQFKLNRSVN